MTPPAAVLWDAWRFRGDEEAFGRLVRPHLRALHDLARRVGVADADDAVQDALLELARHESPRPAEVGVAPWLMRSVWLRARTLRRTGRRRRQHEGAAAKPAEAALAAGEPSGVHEEVERVLASLAPDDRLVLLLRFLYDLDYREVAEVLGVSEATCRVRVHRATTRVRERLGDKAVLLLGSLPLEGTLPATGWIASAVARAGGSGLATAGGAIGMGATAKVAIGAAAAAVLLAGGVWWTTSRARQG